MLDHLLWVASLTSAYTLANCRQSPAGRYGMVRVFSNYKLSCHQLQRIPRTVLPWRDRGSAQG